VSQLDRRPTSGPPKRKLRLDRQHGKLAGVCSGLANYFEMDANAVRLIFVLGTLIGLGSFILIYLAIWLLVD
jgi:phage shock protein C